MPTMDWASEAPRDTSDTVSMLRLVSSPPLVVCTWLTSMAVQLVAPLAGAGACRAHEAAGPTYLAATSTSISYCAPSVSCVMTKDLKQAGGRGASRKDQRQRIKASRHRLPASKRTNQTRARAAAAMAAMLHASLHGPRPEIVKHEKFGAISDGGERQGRRGARSYIQGYIDR